MVVSVNGPLSVDDVGVMPLATGDARLRHGRRSQQIVPDPDTWSRSSSRLLFLRDVVEADLPVFFDFQLDPGANNMAAFTARDPFGFQIIGQSKGFANARG